MPINSHWHALSKASVVLNPLLRHLKGLGFEPLFVPSLSFGDAIDHKRIQFHDKDLAKDKLSNFPIFAWNRTPITCSQETTYFRRIQVNAGRELGEALPYPLNHAWASFTLNWLVLFNNITDFEEFEVVFTAEKLISDFRCYKVFIPPLFGFSKLSEEERSIFVGAEWQQINNADTSKLSEYVQFSFTGTAQFTFSALAICDIELPKIKKLGLNFYSDLKYDNLRDRFEFHKDPIDADSDNTDVDGVIEQTYQEEREIYREKLYREKQ